MRFCLARAMAGARRRRMAATSRLSLTGRSSAVRSAIYEQDILSATPTLFAHSARDGLMDKETAETPQRGIHVRPGNNLAMGHDMSVHFAIRDAITERKGRMATVVCAGSVGTIIEWNVFLIHGTAAALVFNTLFCPNIDPLSGTLASLATLSVGFVARPIGGAISVFRRSGRPQDHADDHNVSDRYDRITPHFRHQSKVEIAELGKNDRSAVHLRMSLRFDTHPPERFSN
jgi:hypothetical protein